MGRDPISCRETKFWGHKTQGNNDNETMKKIIINADRPKINSKKFKYNEFEKYLSLNFQ